MRLTSECNLTLFDKQKLKWSFLLPAPPETKALVQNTILISPSYFGLIGPDSIKTKHHQTKLFFLLMGTLGLFYTIRQYSYQCLTL